jgi:hypothetical protein
MKTSVSGRSDSDSETSKALSFSFPHLSTQAVMQAEEHFFFVWMNAFPKR